MSQISANVGDHSRGTNVPNKFEDVKTIQKLLNVAGAKLNDARFRASDPPDGKIHSDPSKSKTVKALYAFQTHHLKFSRPDGIVEPTKKTHEGLLKFATVPAIPSSSHWDWPLASNKIRRGLTNHTFGMVRKYIDGRAKPHQGWDFYAIPGTSCYAIARGVVDHVRDEGDYGKQVVLKHKIDGETLYSHYAHLSSWSVTAGENVRLGEAIGKTGNTGNASSMKGQDQHLHFEIRTIARAGLGLGGRRSPKSVFGVCPLSNAVARTYRDPPVIRMASDCFGFPGMRPFR